MQLYEFSDVLVILILNLGGVLDCGVGCFLK
jgi:hypothetical protein